MKPATTAFLTGASGYIGQRLAARLVADGYRVVGFDRAPPECPIPGVKFVQGDLLDAPVLQAALDPCDIVFHLAAAKGDWGITREEYYRDNLQATEALIAAADNAGIADWLFYSTVSVLGPSQVALSERSSLAPANPYGASKADCERAFDALIERTPAARVLMIRPSVVFGPGNPWNTNIYRLIDSIARNRFAMIGDGRQVKTTSYIDNLIDATMHLFRLRFETETDWRGKDIYHVVDEPTISVAAMVDHIRDRLGKRGGIRLPLWVASPLALVGDAGSALTGIDLPITSARVRKFCTATNFSARKLAETGFRPKTSIIAGLDRTIDWHLSR